MGFQQFAQPHLQRPTHVALQAAADQENPHL